MVKRLFSLFCIITLSMMAMAQENAHVLTGTITDDAGKGIDHVMCKLLDHKDSILSYAITKNNGTFVIKKNTRGGFLSFSKMGYETRTLPVEENRNDYSTTLRDKPFELKEVTVTIEPIRRSKDTLFYNIDAFRQKEDLHLEDVLKRLPGIEVSANGQISYQGKSINGVNIEGHDLMGSGYNQATQNMPADAVSQIQVMENNQPIKALEDKVHSDKATLNIKLKNGYKMRPFGEVEAGLGSPHKLWDNRLVGILVNKKDYLVLSGAMNNFGNTMGGMATNMTTNVDPYCMQPLPSTFLYSPTYRTPPLDSRFYLRNKSDYIGLNYLHAFSQESTIRLNMLYWHNGEMRKDSTFTRYMSGDTIDIVEARHTTTNTDVAKGQLTYTLNSKKLYLNEALTGMIYIDKSHNLTSTKPQAVDEEVHRRPHYVQNALSGTINTPAHLYNFSSLMRFYNGHERFHVKPQNDFEQLRLNDFFMRHRIGTSFNLFGNNLMLAYFVEHRRSKLSMVGDTVDTQRSHYWLHTLEPVYEIQFEGGAIDINLPLEHLTYSYDWNKPATRQLMFSPLASLNYKFNYFYTFDASVGYNQNADTERTLSNGMIRNDYRTFSVLEDSVPISRATVADGRLSYLNTATMLSWNAYIRWTSTKVPNYLSYIYTLHNTLIYTAWKEKQHKSLSAALSMRKSFRSLGFTINFNNTYSYNKDYLAQNGQEGYIYYNAMSSSLSFTWDKQKWIHAKLMGAGNITWKSHDMFSDSHNLLKGGYYTIRTDFFPLNSLQLYVDFSQFCTELTARHYTTNTFLNMGGRYVANKWLSFSFTANNLLNRRNYEESRYNGVNYSYFTLPLRGREVMLSVMIRY